MRWNQFLDCLQSQEHVARWVIGSKKEPTFLINGQCYKFGEIKGGEYLCNNGLDK